jgi:hypothetical protein
MKFIFLPLVEIKKASSLDFLKDFWHRVYIILEQI